MEAPNENVRLCKVAELKLGMKLGQDVRSAKGAVLIPCGTVLTPYIITKLGLQGIEEVYIYRSELDEPEPVEADTPEDEAFTELYGKVVEAVGSIFRDARAGKKLALGELTADADLVVDKIVGMTGVIRRMHRVKRSEDFNLNHAVNVSIMATLIGVWLDYDAKRLRQLALAGLLHDIGKAKISQHILNKPEKLSLVEIRELRKHSYYSYQIVDQCVGLSRHVTLGVLQHHEREDGSGYPLGVQGERIHPYAKIIAVADIYDEITSDRPYRPKKSPFRAVEMIADESFGLLDPLVARTFLDNICDYFIGSVVRLSTGETGEVIYINPRATTRPIVKVDDNTYVNLADKPAVAIEELLR